MAKKKDVLSSVEKPKNRSDLRLWLGDKYYGLRRKLLWIKMNHCFAKSFSKALLPFTYFSHKTILRRRLKDVDMWLQENKIINLKLAAAKMNGVLLHPGEVFSYWKLIGNPSKKNGYVDGMILKNGSFSAGIGGGLCQMSNLIFWMTLHTPLTIIERHRHGYDVFPDSNRTQPFGSGATCFYPYGDLMIRNDTEDTYQLVLSVGDEYLEGAWKVSAAPIFQYEIEERNHEMRGEYWGGYTRHNELYQKKYDTNGVFLEEKMVVKNSAIMMYSPFIERN
ncbi:MAG: VanW family protein [Oscillospiraceae bacterium]|nr:VanW family protein [Oscillospiraceae bacterium]